MKHFFLLLYVMLAFSDNVFCQSTYYVAANGDDANNGTSAATPLRTIDKVNTLTLLPGSRVLFRRGDTFRGMFIISQSGAPANPITIDAYGSGGKPIIAGSTVLSNWTYTSDGKWQTICSSCGSTVTGLYDNGVSQPLGRYPNPDEPNRGYLTVQSHASNTRVVSKETVPYNFVGGEIAIRSNYFIIDRSVITQQNSNTLSVTNGSAYEFTDNFGFFFQNHPNTVDSKGEWYYNPANKQITLYDNIGNPNNRTITATVFSQCITTRAKTGVSINNIRFVESLNYSVLIENSSDIVLKNCEIANSGEYGVYFSGTGANVLVENNSVTDANTMGFQIDTYTDFTFRNNVIRRVGLEPGRGRSGDNQYTGFSAYSRSNTLIELNRIDSVGYCALNFPAINAVVQKNVVSNYCMTKNDGGGYYITNNQAETTGNVSLMNNIAYNGRGVSEGTPDGFLGANGIYVDNCVSNLNIKNNSLFRNSVFGVYLHDVNNIIAEGNVAFDNDYTQYGMDYNTNCITTNNTTRNNVFVSKLKNQFTALYSTTFNNVNIGSFGSFTNNVYARPLDDVQTIRLAYPPPSAQLYDPQSLKEWQTRFNRDLDSKASSVTFKGYIFRSFTGPERVVGGDFTFNSGYGFGGPFIFSDAGNGQGTWDNNNRVGTGGSLNLSFTALSGTPGASLYAAQVINSVSKDKDYIIRFNAVSTVPNRLVQVYMQPQFPPFLSLVETRPAVVVGTTPSYYEVLVRPVRDLDNALAVLRVFESDQPVFVDNFSFREADVVRVDADKLSTILYNPTNADSTVALNGRYRTVNNQQIDGQIVVQPFSSTVVFREPVQTEALADLTIRLEADRLTTPVNQSVQFRVRISNTGLTGTTSQRITARWIIRLPPNLQVTNSNGLQLQNNILRGIVSNLPVNTDTVFIFQARPATAGTYNITASIDYTSLLDPDSRAGFFRRSGEDDEALLTIRTRDTNNLVFTSPDSGLKDISITIPYSISVDNTKADLSLQLSADRGVAKPGQMVSFTLAVANLGGAYVNALLVQHVLPAGWQFVSGTGWSQNGNTLTASLSRLAAKQRYLFTFIARSMTTGQFRHSAQITASDKADPDSTPNNGFSKGEDDEGQLDIRVIN